MAKKSRTLSKYPGADAADEAILDELHERRAYADARWDSILTEGGTDMQYVSGNTWDDADKKLREGRLCLTFDQLGQYTNQLGNSVRQNKRAIKVTPEGNGATDATAELRANRVRQIEYLSHAQEAYTAAFDGMIERSYGYCRIVSEFQPKGFTKVLRIKPVPNPDQVRPDPDAQSVAGADWKYLFYDYGMTHGEFTRAWPEATVTDFTSREIRTLAGTWLDSAQVRVSEYWTVSTVQKTLLQVRTPDGRTVTVYEAEMNAQVAAGTLPHHATIVNQREEDVPEVCKYLTNGIELLATKGVKRYPWPGRYIPFAACYGKILYMPDGVKIIESYIRHARSPAKYYNWIKSTEGEVMTMPVRATYMAYEGQLSPVQLAALQSANFTAVPVVLVSPFSERTGETVLPFPRRELYDPPIQAYELAAESARRDVQNALGRYSASDHRLGATKVTSGIALQELEKTGDQGSAHFTDSYDAMISHVGVQLVDLMPHFDDTAGDITIRKADDTVEPVRVNDPTYHHPETGQPSPMIDAGHDHAVTVGTGPASASQHEAASAFADTIAGIPEVFPRIADLVIKLKNLGPIGDEIAERLTPPEFKKDGQPDPQQVRQQMGQMKQQLDAAHQLLQKAQQEISGEERKYASAEKITKMKIDADHASDFAANETKLAVAELGAKVDRIALFLKESQLVGARAHDVGMAAITQQHTLDQAQQGQQHALEQGQQGAAVDAAAADQGQQHALEAGQQAADLAPEQTVDA